MRCNGLAMMCSLQNRETTDESGNFFSQAGCMLFLNFALKQKKINHSVNSTEYLKSRQFEIQISCKLLYISN